MPTSKTRKKAASSESTKTRAAGAAARKSPAAAAGKKGEGSATAAARRAAPAAKTPKARMSFAEAMAVLEAAGSAQTRKTYARHGGTGPMFGVSFATLKELLKRIGVDHELGLALWETGNFDARNLAVKIIDPARFTPALLDRWAHEAPTGRMCFGYVGMIAGEGPHASAKLDRWLDSEDPRERASGWSLLGHLAQRDESLPDEVFLRRLAQIERDIHDAPNDERDNMNRIVITIGCRNAALRRSAAAAAKRIGKVEVDHGDTSCKTPDALEAIEKAWAHSTSKGFASPAAQERTRELLRLRC